MATGVSTDDFNQIYSDFKRTVSYSVVTITHDAITGSETTTFAAASNKDVIFFLNETSYMFDLQGLTQVGDAYIIAPTTTGIKRYDQFTVDSKTYYIESTIRRVILGTSMMDYAVCFLVTA